MADQRKDYWPELGKAFETITIAAPAAPTLVLPELPQGYMFTVNETEATPGSTVTLPNTGTITLGLTIPTVQPVTLTPSFQYMEELKLDGAAVTDGQAVTLAPGSHTITGKGATALPNISINGEEITSATVNGTQITEADLPYTFQPLAGQTNDVYVKGQAADAQLYPVTLHGTRIDSATVNGTTVSLPYTFTPTEITTVSMAGEVYQIDLSSPGGAMIQKVSGNMTETLTTGSNSFHQIVDVTADTYFVIDGTHTLTISGSDVRKVTINRIPYTTLPQTVQNRSMTASVDIQGTPPQEVSFTGRNLAGLTVNNEDQTLTPDGNYSFTEPVGGLNDTMEIDAVGAQPKSYTLTRENQNNGSVRVNGTPISPGGSYLISGNSFLQFQPEAIPVNIQQSPGTVTYVNGRMITTADFTVMVNAESNIQIENNTCLLTIDYGDNSYLLIVPQQLVTLTAVHRDWWLFDGWSSADVGIEAPKSVKCQVDLSGHETAHLVCHYQRYPTHDKPNPWN